MFRTSSLLARNGRSRRLGSLGRVPLAACPPVLSSQRKSRAGKLPVPPSPQGHVQVLCNILDFGMNVQQAGDAARVQHFGSARPTGGTMTDGGQVACETGVSPAALDALRAKGHRLIRAPGTFGGYQAILIDWQNAVLHAGTDPRKDGCAMGY